LSATMMATVLEGWWYKRQETKGNFVSYNLEQGAGETNASA